MLQYSHVGEVMASAKGVFRGEGVGMHPMQWCDPDDCPYTQSDPKDVLLFS